MESAVPAHPVGAAGTRVNEGPGRLARAQARAGLYVHVPFCATRCTYCDFATDTLTRARLERYMEAVEREMRLRGPAARGTEFSSIFFGGGTPSVLPSRHIRRLFAVLRDTFAIAQDAEVTLEANPESVRDSLLATWAELGVNRLSLGVQSFDESELLTLGRIHNAKRPAQAVERIRAHGFEHYSLDLMFGYPGHRPERWPVTLQRALELEPEHLSSYCFVAEPCTPLGHASIAGTRATPTPEMQSDWYDVLQKTMSAHGYGCYETSNFARPDREARHNLVYWLRRPYVAVGPSAHGAWAGGRYANERDLDPWAAAVMREESSGAASFGFETTEKDAPEARADEIVMLALRLSSGLQPADYAADVWDDVSARYAAALEAAVATGRLEAHPDGWRIPAHLRFVADDVIAWLASRSGQS